MHAREKNKFFFAKVKARIIRDLKIEVFWHFPRKSRSHVIRALPSGLRFALRFTFVRLDHAPEVSDLPQGFFAGYPSAHTWDFRFAGGSSRLPCLFSFIHLLLF